MSNNFPRVWLVALERYMVLFGPEGPSTTSIGPSLRARCVFMPLRPTMHSLAGSCCRPMGSTTNANYCLIESCDAHVSETRVGASALGKGCSAKQVAIMGPIGELPPRPNIHFEAEPKLPTVATAAMECI